MSLGGALLGAFLTALTVVIVWCFLLGRKSKEYNAVAISIGAVIISIIWIVLAVYKI
ncbi:MAG: hypothetical protein J5379_07210 [Clostridiales bacterium]|nr:hypothetical protein [Clostridiales bacterium]